MLSLAQVLLQQLTTYQVVVNKCIWLHAQWCTTGRDIEKDKKRFDCFGIYYKKCAL